MLKSINGHIYSSKNHHFKYLTVIGLVSFFLLYGCSSVRRTVNGQLRDKSLKNSFHGLVVMNPKTGKTVYNFNGEAYFTPASNVKIVTFYSALKLLPKNIPAVTYAVSNDTLFVEGTGDPSWLHPYLQDSTAIQWLKKQGTIALYLQNFREDRYGPGWAWEDYDAYFSPERSPLPLYGNVVTISYTDSLNVSPVFFRGNVSLKDTIRHRDEFSNRFYIEPTSQDTLEVPFLTSDGLTKRLLETVLEKEIVLSDHFPNADKRTLYGMESDSIYKHMLLESDNFLAEQLLLTASSTLSDTLGTQKTIARMLDTDLKDLEQQPRWVDGSGLSRYNLFTPKSLVQVLQKLYAEIPEERLFKIFPMWDASGTVEKWKDPTIEPFIFAKSGSLGNNYNLSGYLKTKSGKLLIFSFMNNHFKIPTSQIRNTIYTTLQEIYETY
ncbi:MAG: D-alanyl-D-alanine carboxypeptidase [Allomuricauda sp.]